MKIDVQQDLELSSRGSQLLVGHVVAMLRRSMVKAGDIEKEAVAGPIFVIDVIATHSSNAWGLDVAALIS